MSTCTLCTATAAARIGNNIRACSPLARSQRLHRPVSHGALRAGWGRGGAAHPSSARARTSPSQRAQRAVASRPMPHSAFTLLNSVCRSEVPPACHCAARSVADAARRGRAARWQAAQARAEGPRHVGVGGRAPPRRSDWHRRGTGRARTPGTGRGHSGARQARARTRPAVLEPECPSSTQQRDGVRLAGADRSSGSCAPLAGAPNVTDFVDALRTVARSGCPASTRCAGSGGGAKPGNSAQQRRRWDTVQRSLEATATAASRHVRGSTSTRWCAQHTVDQDQALPEPLQTWPASGAPASQPPSPSSSSTSASSSRAFPSAAARPQSRSSSSSLPSPTRVAWPSASASRSSSSLKLAGQEWGLSMERRGLASADRARASSIGRACELSRKVR
jgi:hypothetical protein